MKVFVAASYSSKVNYDTGEVFPEYKDWLERTLVTLESYGHEVFCALRADEYKINDASPAEAYRLDVGEIDCADAMLAILSEKASEGVSTEMGMAIALGKKIIAAYEDPAHIRYFNDAMIQAGVMFAVQLPLRSDPFAAQ